MTNKDYTTCAIKISAYDKVRECKKIMQDELMLSTLPLGSVIERLANLYLKEKHSSQYKINEQKISKKMFNERVRKENEERNRV